MGKEEEEAWGGPALPGGLGDGPPCPCELPDEGKPGWLLYCCWGYCPCGGCCGLNCGPAGHTHI